MAYRYDKDLEFLRNLSSEELNDFVSILTHDKDNTTRFTELITVNELYKKFYPDHKQYLDLILDEFQCFGGNTFANILRMGKGVLYKEILCDVADKLKVNYNKNSDTEIIEINLFMKILENSLDQMSKEQIKEISQELNLNLSTFTKQSTMAAMQFLIKQGSFKSYQLIVIVANAISKLILGRGLSAVVNVSLTKAMSIFVGPIGWTITGMWTAIDIAGPAYRVTIPAVIQIAYLRQSYNMKQNNQKLL
ncbi:DUF3944 domain-containing protein [Campylobacter lari]|uniref:DUF3944 domain-containing protein n=1 Tax=Campylobacter sp. CNRCH_2014_2452 TaxID=2911603 RepID=UPI001271F4BE|nr:DUF3944 domain-containing protein [Campylobacter sp. CNRCH_2014_2452]EAK0818774.1 DUF3944 domain-containing protein [Campylobacter lari]EAK9890369.1 DUF3944 domain-containing protein [Campylobacter lari]EGK8025061.1 DUF3944 domain-containing protein [Campylobacter lari]EGK8128865.1 DUF3944 domain-containing protein [Campylobacter lari]MCV3485839.1 DUF3944 domain-containing protein [Campylobacter sp. CNRCH_2014_2452]